MILLHLFSYSCTSFYVYIFFHSHPVLHAFTSKRILGIQRKQWQKHSCKAHSCSQDRRSLYQGSSKNMVWAYIDENGALWLLDGWVAEIICGLGSHSFFLSRCHPNQFSNWWNSKDQIASVTQVHFWVRSARRGFLVLCLKCYAKQLPQDRR